MGLFSSKVENTAVKNTAVNELPPKPKIPFDLLKFKTGDKLDEGEEYAFVQNRDEYFIFYDMNIILVQNTVMAQYAGRIYSLSNLISQGLARSSLMACILPIGDKYIGYITAIFSEPINGEYVLEYNEKNISKLENNKLEMVRTPYYLSSNRPFIHSYLYLIDAPFLSTKEHVIDVLLKGEKIEKIIRSNATFS